MNRRFLVLIVGSLITGMMLPFAMAQDSGNISASVSQVERSGFPRIDVYISLVDSSGQPIRAVSSSAFTLFEDNAQINDFEVEGSREPVKVMLVLDRSGSMAEAGKMEGAQKAAVAFVNSLRAQDAAGVIVFNSEVDLLQDLTSNQGVLVTAIEGILPEQRTAFYDALWLALEKLDPISGRKSIVALTDGIDTDSIRTANEVVAFAKNCNIPIYTIGLGDRSQGSANESGIDENTLAVIAQESGGYSSTSPDPSQLTGLYALLSEQMRNEYKVSYVSPNLNRDGNNRTVKIIIDEGHSRLEALGRYNPGGIIPILPTPLSHQEQDPVNPNPVSTYDAWFLITLVLLIGLIVAPTTLQSSRGFARDLQFNLNCVKKVKAGSAYLSSYCMNEGPDARMDEDRICAGDWIVICPRCGAVHHLDCWLNASTCNRKCGSPGCTGRGNPWSWYKP